MRNITGLLKLVIIFLLKFDFGLFIVCQDQIPERKPVIQRPVRHIGFFVDNYFLK